MAVSLKTATWRDLETHGKFGKNEKLSSISEDMRIVGYDIGNGGHFALAIDTCGQELSRKILSFPNNTEGFQKAYDWMLELAALYGKKQIVLGIETTGHYWFCLTAWMVATGFNVAQVDPYEVNQTKELEDNSQEKNDRKDQTLIANLLKDENYGMPYLPEGIYVDIRRLNMCREQLTEDRIRAINRFQQEMKIYFPEYMDAFGKIEGTFALEVLKQASFPEDILALGVAGLRIIWHEAKLRGGGYSRADAIVKLAAQSVGLRHGKEAGREAVQWFTEQIVLLEQKIQETDEKLRQKCKEIPFSENLLGIQGIGDTVLAGLLAEMGDISRYDDAKEIQKLSGLELAACSSDKHKGQTKISCRGRKRLRYWLSRLPGLL